jgi:hypothetical protein
VTPAPYREPTRLYMLAALCLVLAAVGLVLVLVALLGSRS